MALSYSGRWAAECRKILPTSVKNGKLSLEDNDQGCVAAILVYQRFPGSGIDDYGQAGNTGLVIFCFTNWLMRNCILPM